MRKKKPEMVNKQENKITGRSTSLASKLLPEPTRKGEEENAYLGRVSRSYLD